MVCAGEDLVKRQLRRAGVSATEISICVFMQREE